MSVKNVSDLWGYLMGKNSNINADFHHLYGEDLFNKNRDKTFKEYREKWNNNPINAIVEDFPLFLDIEVTNHCNLRCPFCNTTITGNRLKKGFISFDNLKKIIDEGANNNLYGVKFNIRGEPLLHPDIVSFVEYAKKKGLIDIYFNTNATLLTEEMSYKLIEAGLDRISISFEGYTKDIYESYRVGSNYENVLKNIETLQKIKQKNNLLCPKVRIQTINLESVKNGTKSMSGYIKFWKDKVDEVCFLDFRDEGSAEENVRGSWRCPQLWQRMAIFWDGTICACNNYKISLSLGNIEYNSIKECFHSKELNRIREKHINGTERDITECKKCCLRCNEITKMDDKNV